MKALCLVAHPDDCVIFAYSFIHNHPEHEWTIGYLTYTAQDPRGQELSAFWKQRGIECVFLGFEDHWHDNEQKVFTRWPEESADRACWHLALALLEFQSSGGWFLALLYYAFICN